MCLTLLNVQHAQLASDRFQKRPIKEISWRGNLKRKTSFTFESSHLQSTTKATDKLCCCQLCISIYLDKGAWPAQLETCLLSLSQSTELPNTKIQKYQITTDHSDRNNMLASVLCVRRMIKMNGERLTWESEINISLGFIMQLLQPTSLLYIHTEESDTSI